MLKEARVHQQNSKFKLYLYLRVSVKQQPDEKGVRPAPLVYRADKALDSCSYTRLTRRTEDEEGENKNTQAGPAEELNMIPLVGDRSIAGEAREGRVGSMLPTRLLWFERSRRSSGSMKLNAVLMGAVLHVGCFNRNRCRQIGNLRACRQQDFYFYIYLQLSCQLPGPCRIRLLRQRVLAPVRVKNPPAFYHSPTKSPRKGP